MKRFFQLPVLAVLGLAASAPSCSSGTEAPYSPSTFVVHVTQVNGGALPAADAPLPANDGSKTDRWTFDVTAVDGNGKQQPFTGYVRLRVEPGTVTGVTSQASTTSDRNIFVQNGTASGVAEMIAVYGDARLWVEDLGYIPVPKGPTGQPLHTPQCADGKDNNDNGLIDYPSDPGCYYADDDSEEGGTYAAGVSDAIHYQLPRISDVRGSDGARTPWPNEAISVDASAPEKLIVTRLSNNGFFVTDVSPQAMSQGRNSLFAYNFSVPPNMAVCDQILSLAGTANDFYGFTQLGFPTWSLVHVSTTSAPTSLPSCLVPDPTLIDPNWLNGNKTTIAQQLYPYEAGLVRLDGFRLPLYLGSGLAFHNKFSAGTSNCDYNGDGQIDYTQIAPNCPLVNGEPECEGDCSTQCDADPDCSSYTDFSSRSEVKVSLPGTMSMIKINVSTVASFNVNNNVGKTLDHVFGSLTEFSGGNLNWTVEARCQDDLVCPKELGCTTQTIIPVTKACVAPPTQYDNDEGTN